MANTHHKDRDQAEPPPESTESSAELKGALLAALFGSGPAADAAWQEFSSLLSRDYDSFFSGFNSALDEAHQALFFQAIFMVMARWAFASRESQVALFRLAQSMGIHVLPAHFYSVVPNTTTLREELWDLSYREGWGLMASLPGQFAWLNRLSRWASEVAALPFETEPAGNTPFYLNNPAFNACDAFVYYALIRELKPRRICEIGVGYSTMLAARAALANRKTMVDGIDPYPMELLSAGLPGLSKLYNLPVQEMPLDYFAALQANDILFVDSTHVTNIGSDLNHIMFRILPLLAPGVFVHFHDIFLPWEFPKNWIDEHNIFWNEQYLVLAFLMHNESYELVLANQFLGREHPEALRAAFPALPVIGGGSFWIRKRLPHEIISKGPAEVRAP